MWIITLALTSSAILLFALFVTLRRFMPPRRAVFLALALSAFVHAATVFVAEPERWLPLTLFWLGPHLLLLLLPLLLFLASRPSRI